MSFNEGLVNGLDPCLPLFAGVALSGARVSLSNSNFRASAVSQSWDASDCIELLHGLT